MKTILCFLFGAVLLISSVYGFALFRKNDWLKKELKTAQAATNFQGSLDALSNKVEEEFVDFGFISDAISKMYYGQAMALYPSSTDMDKRRSKDRRDLLTVLLWLAEDRCNSDRHAVLLALYKQYLNKRDSWFARNGADKNKIWQTKSHYTIVGTINNLVFNGYLIDTYFLEAPLFNAFWGQMHAKPGGETNQFREQYACK